MIPNSPYRRAHVLQAHALRARGYTIAQIAEQTGHAPSTVHAWLRALDDHREQFVALFAQDQLLVLLHSHAALLRINELHPPQTAEQATLRHQQFQSYATIARELRMVCAQLSRTKGDIYGAPDDPPMSAAEVDAITPAPGLQQQLTALLTAPTQAEEPESSRTELEISERPESESPEKDGESADPPPEKSSTESRPQPVRRTPRPSFLASTRPHRGIRPIPLNQPANR